MKEDLQQWGRKNTKTASQGKGNASVSNGLRVEDARLQRLRVFEWVEGLNGLKSVDLLRFSNCLWVSKVYGFKKGFWVFAQGINEFWLFFLTKEFLLFFGYWNFPKNISGADLALSYFYFFLQNTSLFVFYSNLYPKFYPYFY